MTSIEATSLPSPGYVVTSDESAVLISDIGNLPFHHRPDPALRPRRFRLFWANANGAVGDAIRRHHDDHPHAVFSFTIPRTGEVVFAMWANPPNIQWASETTVASINAEVEEVLAYE